jgi:predicted nucleic acid-binding protein
VKIVCNTSPAILLAKIGRLELFSELYDRILIPASVLDEIEAKPSKETKRITALVMNQTFEIRRAPPEILEGLPADLGAGEREAIALAIETQADLVVLDDQQGRRVARERELSVTGTVGVLIEARERGIIPSVRPELDRLIEAGMWIDEVFYHRVLQEFDE